MTYKFTNAIVRKPNKSIHNALSSQYLHPNYEKILEIHKNYITAIKEAGLNTILLDSLEKYPDSIFVEDPALIFKNNIIILNPSEFTRKDEAIIIKKEISKYFEKIFVVEKGAIEGGDILNINNHFIIGLSNRSDKLGQKIYLIYLSHLVLLWKYVKHQKIFFILSLNAVYWMMI